MYKSFSMELAGRTLTVDIGRVCAQANGAALIKYGETTVLSTVVASDKPRDGVDFFPLSVEFEEKMYAVGKIPGGFNKREGKASENAILTSRVIDRPMRPLFPKDYRNDVTLNNMVMSVDPECRPEVVGMIGSALVTTMSDIPFDGPCAMTQMGMVDGEFIVNPSQKVWDKGDLQLTVASTRTKVIMIEAGANEIPEEKMIEAIYKCHDVNQTIIQFMDKIVAECGKPKHEYTSCAIPDEMFAAMKELKTTEFMSEGFAVLPHPDMSPAAAYEQLVLDNVEKVDLDGVAERTLATGIVPYPPGIPLIMPGENAGPADGPALGYLKALEGFDRQFPAFEHDSHGVEVENGKYYVTVLKK